MTLTDAGFLYAIVNQRDQHSERCRTALKQVTPPLLTTWPCFTEAMYFANAAGGWKLQNTLWSLIKSGTLNLHIPNEQEVDRMHVLMERYHDTPMDLADASLVTTAESLGLRRILTTDSDFYVYQISDRFSFEVLP